MSTKRIVINIIYSIICFALGVAVFVVMLKCAGVRIFIHSKGRWTCADCSFMNVAFGVPKNVRGNTVFDASTLLCLVPCLLFLGAFLILFTAFDSLIKRKTRFIFGIIATLFFFIAGVLFFLTGQLYNLGDYFYRNEVIEQILTGNMKLHIGPGAIIAGLLSFYVAYASAIKSVLTIVKVL